MQNVPRLAEFAGWNWKIKEGEKEMNDNEVTWNLSATKAFKEKFTLKLEGYDLLNQRKNVQYAVTPQGRTVTVRNVLRRYAMAHFVWKFSVGKKKG